MGGFIRIPIVRFVTGITAIAVMISACDRDHGTRPDGDGTATDLRIDPESPILRLGERITLTPVFTDAAGLPANAPDAPLTWTSSDPDVLAVDSVGVLYAAGPGAATIRARAGTLVGGTSASVLAPQERTGENTPVTRTIDQSGGVIEATAPNGLRYTLNIPAHALDGPVDITITPIDSIDAFPIAGGTAGAVALEPEGLTFLMPAELTIVTAGGARSNVGFTMSNEFRLLPARVNGDTARLAILHFSSAGAADATEEEVNALAELPADQPDDKALQEIAAAVAEGENDADVDADRVDAALRAWLNDGVIPDLAAVRGEALDTALAQYVAWAGAVDMWALDRLEAEKAQAGAAAAAALRAEIDRLNAQCEEQNDLAPLDQIEHWAGRAEQLNLAAYDQTLALESVVASLCAQPVIISVELPDTLEGSATLEVNAGISIGGRNPIFNPPVAIEVSGPGVTVSPREGVVDGTGLYTAEVSLRTGYMESPVDIVASLPSFPLAQARRTLMAEGRIRLQVRVNDELDTTVEPGGQVEVIASLLQGSAGMVSRIVTVELLGPGHLSRTETVVLENETGAAAPVIYTAPDENATVQVVGSFREGSFVIADTATITVAGTCSTPLPDFEYYGPAGVFVENQEDDGGGTVDAEVVAAEPHHLSYRASIRGDTSNNWISARGYMYVDDYLIIEPLEPFTGFLTLHIDAYIRGEQSAYDPLVETQAKAWNDFAGVGVDLEGRTDDPRVIERDTTVNVLLDNDVSRIEGGWIPMRHWIHPYVRTRGAGNTGSVSAESRMDIRDYATDSEGRQIPIRICSALGAGY